MIRFLRDVWLSNVLERPVFSLHDPDAATVTRAVDEHARGEAGAFYFAKLDSADVRGVDALSAAGFRVVEASVTLGMPVNATRHEPEPTSHLQILPAIERWREPVLAIAGTTFRYSRFHLDPGFERAAADRVKREWIRSYFDGCRGDRLLVALEGEEPVGFLALLLAVRSGRRVGVIDLIGVRPDCQRQGIGRRLVDAAIDACRENADVLEVGTQTANVPSLRLYEQTGFTIVRTGFVMHRHTAG